MENYAHLKQLYIDGVSIRELERRFSINRQKFSKMLKDEGILIRDNTINSRIYTVDSNYFDKINSDDKAYWLGFMYTDGFVNSKRGNASQSFGITLSASDANHLEKFKKFLKADYPVKFYKGSGFNSDGEFARLLICDQKLVNSLKELGCCENKTKILRWPTEDKLPSEYQYSFLRGLLDGDGTISTKTKNTVARFSWLATYDICEHIRKLLKLDSSITPSKHSDYLFCIRPAYHKYKTELDKVYAGATVYLDRKYAKYLQILEDC